MSLSVLRVRNERRYMLNMLNTLAAPPNTRLNNATHSGRLG